MKGMRQTNLVEYDLNLLLIFEALMEHKNVSAAASALGLTQPTVSHALNRLRRMYGDQLFVRTGRGMQPTSTALKLFEPLVQALGQIRSTLECRESFNPTRDARTFRLLLTDIGSVTFLPSLLKYLQENAPRVRLDTDIVSQAAYKDVLENGQIDLAIGQMPSLSGGFFQQRIFEDEYVCVVGVRHPRIRKAPTLVDYLQEQHVRVVVPGRPQSAVDEALAKLNMKRSVMISVPQYLAILPILSATQLVATVPRRVFSVTAMG
jgi:DNA-binding transcriptional LysR family regulator